GHVQCCGPPRAPVFSTCVPAAEVPVPWASEAVVSFAVVAPFSLPAEPAWEAADPVEPVVSTCVPGAEVPVPWAREAVVSFAVVAPFSLPAEPAWDAADPIEP